MADKRKVVQLKWSEGAPIEFGNTIVTPINQALIVRLPYWRFVWNRPAAVRVDDGRSISRLRIVDVTLLAQVILLAVSLAASIVALTARRA